MDNEVTIIFVEKLGGTYMEDVWEILKKANSEFVPPLSMRNSTCQRKMTGAMEVNAEEPTAYFDMMKQQKFILAIQEEKVVGFLSFISNHQIQYPLGENVEKAEYITTIVVEDEHRNIGITKKLYQKMFELSLHKKIITRTWSTNYAHIHILEALGFVLVEKIANDRGEGIATVYYRRTSEE